MKPQPSQFELAAYLIIHSQIYPIRKQVTTIGRKLENDLVIENPLVSRHHAEIHRIGDTYKIVDLQSTSGTFINQLEITECTLYSGDIILVADTPLMFINQGLKVRQETRNPTSSLIVNTNTQDSSTQS